MSSVSCRSTNQPIHEILSSTIYIQADHTWQQQRQAERVAETTRESAMLLGLESFPVPLSFSISFSTNQTPRLYFVENARTPCYTMLCM